MDPNKSGYTDPDTGIDYVSDGPYVDDAGESHATEGAQPRRYQTVRSFPSGVRNCYALPTEAGEKHLLRAEAFYGNYDGRNSSAGAIQFDLYLGGDPWETASVGGAAAAYIYEAVFVAWAGWTPVCLVNTGHGTPFVSALELRPLGDELYPPVAPGLSMAMYTRVNVGANTSFIRYPMDEYDRFWWPPTEVASPRSTNLSTQQTIQPNPSFAEPLVVLQTAAAAAGNGTALTVTTWQDASRAFMVFLHFADFQNAKFREFDIYLNGVVWSSSFDPSFLAASCVYNPTPYNSTDGNYNITLVATAKSVLPPMINGFEIYYAIPRVVPTTFPEDIDAIMAIKFEYGVKKNWVGDPCFPTNYTWNGVKCTNTSGNTTRITSLDLSKSNLQGAISTNFTLLTALQNLDLSYNNFSGSIPDPLLNLASLKVLNVSGNHLDGNSQCKKNTGSLIFRYDSGTNTCRSQSRKNTAVLVIIVVVVLVLVVAIICLAYFIWKAKRKATVSINDHTRNEQLENAPRSRTSEGDHLQDSENRRFMYKDLEKFTDNFKGFLGQGGFGLVYYGHLEDGTEVAVKMRSESSSHGLDEFLAEVQSLTKVHHRNIVSLVGYCWEKDHLALVYEYMSQGNLHDHLKGKISAAETLNWGTRVQILLEAAQGLDYLHNGCSPPIIHRDVKSSNILLGQNLQAKIADLGLSRTYLNDAQTHISATAAGTAGYMDPEYYLTGRLTESSDVYSFGVVLLEAATGEPPMVPGHGHIVQRVKQRIASTGDVGSIADARFRGAYDVSSMWKVVDTAMACTAEAGAGRPTMADVVAQLKDSLALEYAREDECSVPMSVAASDSAGLVSAFGPSAR
ncbi:hypothetical protein HU200_013526 [Digitaria exilis]|uniref:non-specific serine/threonine protein kinase n=1 Tax=Digitaria exilis TaxID=1010633 RepID=A0A835KKY9_9POAL|nr:hypothetical protein HU200_013526 [Digitaria exilis]